MLLGLEVVVKDSDSLIALFIFLSNSLTAEGGLLAENMEPLKAIRTFNGCEVRIENSVTRVTVRHHKACQVMPNSYPA